MKKFVKILAVLTVIALLATSFVACSKKEEKVLVMATNAAFPPYEYIDGEGFAGIDVDIANLIAEELGMTLEIKDVEFGSIIGGVQSGKYDFGMAGMTVTEERLENVNFTTSYANGIQAVIVKADSPYTSFEDFYTGFDAEGNPAGVKEGIKIGVQQDTTGDIYASDTVENGGYGEDNVIRYKTGADAVQALVAGKVQAVIIDNEPAKAFVAANEGLEILDAEWAREDYAIAIAKENTDLLEKINKALAELEKEGKLAEIINKYIPA